MDKEFVRGPAVPKEATPEDLLRAVANGELTLYYQPQVSLQDEVIFGVEALLRWRHPQYGVLAPRRFLSALEAGPAVLAVGWWILNEACRTLQCWHDSGIAELRVGVNLFSDQFRSATLAQQVRAALADSRLDPSALELEVTETTALHYDPASLAVLHELRAHGVRIALDDFGTGHASLRTLKEFPLTTLKIDRGFVKDLLTNASDAAITRATISLALELGLDIIAEGIETRDQEAALRALGCKAGQGYRYGKPRDAASMAELLHARATDRS